MRNYRNQIPKLIAYLIKESGLSIESLSILTGIDIERLQALRNMSILATFDDMISLQEALELSDEDLADLLDKVLMHEHKDKGV